MNPDDNFQEKQPCAAIPDRTSLLRMLMWYQDCGLHITVHGGFQQDLAMKLSNVQLEVSRNSTGSDTLFVSPHEPLVAVIITRLVGSR